MRLYEFAGKDPIVVKLVVLSNQLKTAVENGEIQEDWTTEQLLDFLQTNGINVDEPDIFDMVKKPPLSGVINSIDNDVVSFKGLSGTEAQSSDQDQSLDQSKAIVKQMASNAAK